MILFINKANFLLLLLFSSSCVTGMQTERCSLNMTAHCKHSVECLVTVANPWGPNSHVQDYPWSPGIHHGVHVRLYNPARATRPRIQVPPTAMLYAPSPIRLHYSGYPILEHTAG